MCIHVISLGGKAADFMIYKTAELQLRPFDKVTGKYICRFVGIAFVIRTLALWPNHGRF
jgi:hypothetical protein